MTIRRMRVAYWIPQVTNTHSEYVTLTAFPLQRWLNERASLLRYMYIACLLFSFNFCSATCTHKENIVNLFQYISIILDNEAIVSS